MLYQFVIYPASQKKTSPDPEKPKPQTVSVSAPNTQLAAAPSPVQNAVTPVKQYDSWGRDPFTYSKTLNAAPSTSVSVRKEKRKLRGILWKQGKVFVVIDDIVLAEGEEEKGLKVERIDGTAAVCREGGRTFTLKLTEEPL
jgi:hypothetical protein